MRKRLVLGSLVALLSPLASRAQLGLGLRVGYAPAMGDAARGLTMKEASLKAQIPLQLDALYAIDADVAVGAYFAYGFGQTDGALFAPAPFVLRNVCGRDLDGTGGTVECSGRSIRLGAQGVYTFHQVRSPVVPWAGLSFGYERVSLEAKDDLDEVTLDLGGFDLGLQVGGDYALNDRFSFGPYVTFHVGRYQRMRFENTPTPGLNFDGSIDDKALHQWLGFGLRGRLDL